MRAWGRGHLVVRLVAVVSLTLGVVACEPSKIDPDADVSISGRVRTPSGAPLADRPVRLASAASGGELALAAVTLGLACTTGICDDTVRSGRTDADGRYRIEIKGRDTQTSFGNVRSQVLSASAAPSGDEVSGASVAARFVVQTERVRIPPLQLVDPALSVQAASGRAAASWEPSPGAPYTLAFETDSVIPVWRLTTAQTAASVDSRVLEGSSGRVVLSGRLEDEIDGSDLDLTWRSPGVGYAADGAPMSRGASCTYGTAKPVSPTDIEGRGCGLTDGDLFSEEAPVARCPARPSPRRGRACKTPTTATIEVPSPGPVDLIVVRGCDGNCPVEVSSDGRRWRAVGSATTPFAAVPLSATNVRSVRVGLGISGLREVSVWGPADPLEPGLEPVPEAALETLRKPYDSGGDVEKSGVPRLVWVAAGLLLVALVGAAYLAGRRRGSVTPS